MYPRTTVDNQPRTNGAVPPPGGATLASFVLFASLAGLIAFLYIGGEWLSLAGGLGLPTDAAWVRAVFARSIATGHGLTFTAGTPVAGAAAPSWVLALGLAAAPSGNFVVAAKMLGVLSLTLSAFLAWAITRRLLDDWRFAFLAGLLVIASPLLATQALGGTEGVFAGMLALAAIYWQGLGWEGNRRQRVIGALALGAAALARPELLLLLPLALLDRWVVAWLHGRMGARLISGLTRSFPEVIGAFLVTVPYILYCLHAGGPRWQQPELSLRLQPPLAWAKLTVLTLWSTNPMVLVLAAAGLFVAALAAARQRTEDPSFLPTLLPLALLLLPGFLWPDANSAKDQYWPFASAANPVATAAALTPLLCVLGASGLYALYRLGQALLARGRNRATRLAFGFAVAVVVLALFGLMVPRHRIAWNQHKDGVLRLYSLQVAAGKWAEQHLASDASIAAREVGAIGFFSNRRVVDLGGSISPEGIRALRRTGSPDADLLAYLEMTKPSHLAIRPADFPDLAKRPDLLTQVITCLYTDKDTGGVTTYVLYETPWPSASMRAAAQQNSERSEHAEHSARSPHHRRR